ncbi:MAG TPA: hypothetical protein VE134_07920 [Methanomicrobiales archaeon]|nr:hypothetical protein [Methanomicrobiales archaeon]
MRRIYHRFPNIIDLDFEVSRPFRQMLACLRNLHNSHTTDRKGQDLVKRSVVVQVATDKTGFEPLDRAPSFEAMATEVVDYRISLQDTLLKPDARVPASQSSFFVRVADKGTWTECTVVKDGKSGPLDAMDIKDLITGACG